jgi:hypothetical protein
VTLDDLKKIILIRSKLEAWHDQIFFKNTVMGAFVRVSHSGKYRIAEIVNIKDDGASYILGKKTTNI